MEAKIAMRSYQQMLSIGKNAVIFVTVQETEQNNRKRTNVVMIDWPITVDQWSDSDKEDAVDCVKSLVKDTFGNSPKGKLLWTIKCFKKF